jgi:alginate O-acetyltransferase complex protein AlgI
LFIPLGGSRHGVWKTNRNLLVTMTLGGLWHGANWPFVVWGFLQGALLVVHRLWLRVLEPFPGVRAVLRSPPGTATRVGFTFLLFAMTLVFFRSPTLETGWEMFDRLFVPAGGLPAPLLMRGFWASVVFLVVGHAAGWYLTRSPFVWRRAWMQTPAPILGVAGAAAIAFAVLLAPGATKAFIYFQF